MNKKTKTAKIDYGNNTALTPIAVIGLAGILPEAENLNQYWENILHEVDCIREVPPSRWNIEDYYDPDPSAPDKTYCKYGGFIPDIQFDPMEFGLPPNLLEVTDVSQLLSLIVAKNALTDAGYLQAGEDILDHTGVILGMVGMSSKVIHPLLNRLQYPIWERVLKSTSIPENEVPEIIEKMKLAYIAWNENAFPGAIGNVVAGRVANRLDLGGTNCIVDAACGSSLAAVSMAVSELALGRADMMISGGVDTDNSILTYLCFSKTPAFSKGGHSRAFSAESDGMLTGEGIGMLVLKRLQDAERDNDRIYSVIRGIGSSSDGHFKSIYAPRPSGQAKAVRRAYKQAGYSSSSVRLIEAHGTGTIAGDPAEFEGLIEAFGENSPLKQVIALGSVKSQIGHTKATAGAAGLIKASLALHQKVLPATINVSKPHPAMHIETTPFYLNTETRPWFKDKEDNPRRAGVSSFGFGGTNFHITLEEYQDGAGGNNRISHVPNTILISAQTPDQLIQNCRETLTKMEGADQHEYLNQLDKKASESSIPSDHARVGFVAITAEDARENLQECIKMLSSEKDKNTWSHPKGIFYRNSGIDPTGKTVALFPGQGSQYVNMGRELAINFSAFREAFEHTDEKFTSNGKKPLTSTVFPIPVFSENEKKSQAELLTKTENAQPSIGTFSLALYQLLQVAGFQADFYAGHSFGELTALWASGVYDQDAFIRLAKARGEAMSLPATSDKDTGTMIAVKGDVEKINSLLEGQNEVTVANYNSPSQVVLAGSTEAVQAVKPKLEGLGFSVYQLQVSAAFHTSFVEHAQAPFTEAIKKETFNEPVKAVYSNSTACKHENDPQKIARNLSEHILSSVKFKEEIENIYNNGGSVFVEIGPKKILTNLVKDILKDKSFEIITLNPNPKGSSDLQFRQAVLQMRVLGFKLGDVDPRREYLNHSQPNPSKVSVTLNGGFYITQKTQDNFENALKKENHSKRRKSSSEQRSVPAAEEMKESAIQNSNRQNKFSNLNTYSKEESPSLDEGFQMNTHQFYESLIDHFQEHQSDFMKTHELFLQNDNVSKKTLQDVASAELSILSNMNGNAQSKKEERALSLLEKRADFVNCQHSGTSAAHLEYIKTQTDFLQQYTTLINKLVNQSGNGYHPTSDNMDFLADDKPKDFIIPIEKMSSPQKDHPQNEINSSRTETSPSAAHDVNQLTQSFLQIVSDKTGYPTDMLELTMDMEADLGIDSIKRVEILGAMQEQYPDLPTISAEDLALLRTLEQIIGAFNTNSQGTQLGVHDQNELLSQPDIEEVDKGHINTSVESDLQTAFLDIVSEKTGYPADMLELGMDMEADLGIDSIKRVEILGAMQEQFPQLSAIGAEDLALLRTLEQIIQKFIGDEESTASSDEKISVSPQPETIQPDHSSIERYIVKVKQLPKPDFLKFETPKENLILITDDCTEKSQLLAEFFSEQDLNVGMVHFSAAENKEEKHSKNGMMHFYISEPDENEIQSKMNEIISDHKKISAFIHVNPPANRNQKDLMEVSGKSEDILKSVFLIARHLKKPLMAAVENGRAAFLTVSQMDGQFGLNNNSLNDPLQGGFSGLTKSLRLEWNNVFCRAIDIHPDIDPQTAVKLIDDELHDTDLHITEVGYTPDGRFTLALDKEN